METKQYPDMECDVVIAGCGVAGLYAALNLPTSMRVIMLSKGAIDECDSMLAQGGICVLPEGSDYDAFFEDTMHAGHYENRRESVDIMIRSSRSVINDLLAMGVDFERKADGSLDFTREGAHSRPRIAFHADITGKEITTKLLQAVRKLDNVQILEHVAMTDILTGERDGATVCAGVVAVPVDEDNSVRPADELINAAEGAHAGEPFKIHARHTLWATGGIGGIYDHSTNYPQLTGDACYIAQEHGIKMEHLDYVQIHPTGLFSPQPGRTSMPELYAAGETACNGVHGKNRLASNSLLEALVWGRRAAWYMRTGESLAVEQAGEPALDGRHRALSAHTLAIDDLARAAGTQAVEE